MFQVSSLKTHIFNCEHYFQVLYLNRSGSINVQMSCSVLAFATTSEISFLTAQHSGLFCSRYSEFISLTLNKSMFRSVFKHKVREWKIKNNNNKKTTLPISDVKANYFNALYIQQLLLIWHLLSIWPQIFKSNASSVAWRQKFLSLIWKKGGLI